jgi:hypothetical protein
MTSHDGKSKKATRKTKSTKGTNVKSLEFCKPTLATMLAIVLAWLLSVRPAQAGYIVTLQQVGLDVVATGSGAIDLRGLTFSNSSFLVPEIRPFLHPLGTHDMGCSISTGPFSSMYQDPRQSVDSYRGGLSGPTSFGPGNLFGFANGGGGNMVGIAAGSSSEFKGVLLSVPKGYVSGTALSDSATYRSKTFATLGVTPGTYVWKWGAGANQNFTLQILPAPNIINISARAAVGTAQNVAIAGFTISGTGSKSIVVRGLGPSLAQPPFNVPGVLADPFLSLRDGNNNVLWNNNNWRDSQQTQIQNLGLACAGAACAPPNDLESAILQILPPGKYTAILSGNNSTGVGLVEVYDTSTGASAEFTNVSTRGFVGTDENVLIAGFIASGGNGITQVVVRGLGPTLGQPPFNVPGALGDPFLSLRDSNGNVLWNNNDWKDSQQAEIENLGLACAGAACAPPNELESAILRPVAPGNYTAILSGRNRTTGIGLLEVYKVPGG